MNNLHQLKKPTSEIFSIAKKELKGYLDTPTAYIVLVIFLALWEFLFFRNAFLIGTASLRALFDLLPWLLLLLIPAITMGSISQEEKEGTLEFLLTHPVTDYEVLVGKFIAALSFTAIALGFIFPIAWSFSAFGNLDWGAVFGQYLAGFLLASTFISLGILVSSLFKNQIPALLTSVVSGFFLIVAGSELVSGSLPLAFAGFLEQLSASTHFNSMARGVIDLRDLWYFLSAAAIFLSLAYLKLLKRRFGNRRSLYRSFQTGILLFIGIAVLTNVVGSRIPGRIDLTQNHLYTLGSATKTTLANLPDVVNITLFASGKLPAQFQPTLRSTKDLLRDYQTVGKGNLIVSIKNPDNNSQVASEANGLGVREAQFNVVGQGELQLKTGYLGLSVSYAGKHEVIPFIKNTNELEYQLTGLIKQLTVTDKKKIAFLAGHGEKSFSSDYHAFSEELKKQFEVKEVSFDKDNTAIPENTVVLVIAGPTQKIDDKARASIKSFLEKGGSALFLIDAVQANPQMMSASPNLNSFADFLDTYGIKIQKDLVYDLKANETVRFGGGVVSYALPYPFWLRAQTATESPATSKVESVTLAWPSSIAIDQSKVQTKNLTAKTLLTTTKFGGQETKNFSIAPNQKFPQENLQKQTLAVSLSSAKDSSNKNEARLVVIGDSEFLTNQFIQSSPENAAFGMGVLAWLGQENSLAGLRAKQQIQRKLLFENKTQVALVKYGNLLLAALLPLGFGVVRLMRRRNLQKLTYAPTDKTG